MKLSLFALATAAALIAPAHSEPNCTEFGSPTIYAGGRNDNFALPLDPPNDRRPELVSTAE